MSSPIHVAPATERVRFVVIPLDDGYCVYRSTRHGNGKWFLDLSDSAGFSPGLGTAIRFAEDAARHEREQGSGRFDARQTLRVRQRALQGRGRR